jgi:hypothetical protein
MIYEEGEIPRARMAFAGLLREVWQRAGNPSYRALAVRSGRELSPASLSRLLNGEGWPSWRVVDAFLRSCRVDLETFARCHRAWESVVDLRTADQMSAKRPAGIDCHECGAYVPTENARRHREWHERLTSRLPPTDCASSGHLGLEPVPVSGD